MTTPAPRMSELHGDMYDGLVLVTRLSDPAMSVFIVPVEPLIRTREQYAQWVPRPGQEVVIYQSDGKSPRRTETSRGMFHHHYEFLGRKVLGTEEPIQ